MPYTDVMAVSNSTKNVYQCTHSGLLTAEDGKQRQKGYRKCDDNRPEIKVCLQLGRGAHTNIARVVSIQVRRRLFSRDE